LYLRFSCLPTNHGESIVMRILDKEGLKLAWPELGFFSDDQQLFEKSFHCPTAFCSSPARRVPAKRRRCIPVCISSIVQTANHHVEDPVEYFLAASTGAGQRNGRADVRYALRASCAAPNVIMIGEIRDIETAVHRHQRLAHRPFGFLQRCHQRRARRRHALD